MGKSLFTILFLIVSLLVASKLKSFVKNNAPINIPNQAILDQSPEPDQVNPVIYEATTTAATTDTIATTTASTTLP